MFQFSFGWKCIAFSRLLESHLQSCTHDHSVVWINLQSPKIIQCSHANSQFNMLSIQSRCSCTFQLSAHIQLAIKCNHTVQWQWVLMDAKPIVLYYPFYHSNQNFLVASHFKPNEPNASSVWPIWWYHLNCMHASVILCQVKDLLHITNGDGEHEVRIGVCLLFYMLYIGNQGNLWICNNGTQSMPM